MMDTAGICRGPGAGQRGLLTEDPGQGVLHALSRACRAAGNRPARHRAGRTAWRTATRPSPAALTHNPVDDRVHRQRVWQLPPLLLTAMPPARNPVLIQGTLVTGFRRAGTALAAAIPAGKNRGGGKPGARACSPSRFPPGTSGGQ